MSDFSVMAEYHQEIRTALFVSGFTLGSFLFSMKSVIVKTMKEDYYDSDEYQDQIRQRRGIGDKIGYYSQLKNFSKLLISAITLSFISALSQISIGYIDDDRAVLFCLLIAFASWIVVGFSIYIVSENWLKAIQFSEDSAQQKEVQDINKKENR